MLAAGTELGMAGEIFISYRRSDAAWARLLHSRLAAEGVDAWYDAHVGAGQDWRAATATALSNARIFVLLFSKAASESDDIAKELAAATFSKKLVIPVRIENIQPEGAFLYELASRNWVNAFDNTEARLAELAKSLAGVVNGASPDVIAGLAPASHRPASRKWILGAGAMVLAAAIGFGMFHMLGGGDSKPAQTAFFGFDAAGGEVARDIAATANDETIATLTAMRLSTIASSETLGVRPDRRLAEASRLGARYAVSGDVRVEGPRVKVTVRLEDVPSRVALWSATRDGAVGEPLGAQAAALATDVLGCFMQRMQGRESRVAELGALVGRQCRDMRFTALDVVQTSRELARLVPDSATIQGTLGLEILLTLGATPPSARLALIAEAEAATLAALKLDPTDPWANLAHFQLLSAKEAPLAEREQALRKGLKSHPSDATLNFFLGTFLLRGAGMIEASLPHMAVGVVEDPLSAPKLYAYANALMLADKRAEAESKFNRAAMLGPPSPFTWQLRVRAALFGGIGKLGDLLDHPPPPVSREAVGCWRDIAAAMPQKNRATRMAAAARIRPCVDSGALQADAGIMAAAQLGDLDVAFAVAEYPLSSGSGPGTVFIRQTAAMRLDPRFEKLAVARHWTDYWRATKQVPDFCRTEQAPVCAALR